MPDIPLSFGQGSSVARQRARSSVSMSWALRGRRAPASWRRGLFRRCLSHREYVLEFYALPSRRYPEHELWIIVPPGVRTEAGNFVGLLHRDDALKRELGAVQTGAASGRAAWLLILLLLLKRRFRVKRRSEYATYLRRTQAGVRYVRVRQGTSLDTSRTSPNRREQLRLPQEASRCSGLYTRRRRSELDPSANE